MNTCLFRTQKLVLKEVRFIQVLLYIFIFFYSSKYVYVSNCFKICFCIKIDQLDFILVLFCKRFGALYYCIIFLPFLQYCWNWEILLPNTWCNSGSDWSPVKETKGGPEGKEYDGYMGTETYRNWKTCSLCKCCWLNRVRYPTLVNIKNFDWG